MVAYRKAIFWLSFGSVCFFLVAASLTSIGAVAPWYLLIGGAFLGFSTILSAMHFVAAWQLFYGTPLYWRAFGQKRMWRRFILLPAVYCAAYFFVSAWLWENHFHWKLLLFWFLICIPNTFHNLGQDRGILTILNFEAPRAPLVLVRNFLLFLVFPVVMLVRTREMLRTGLNDLWWLQTLQLALASMGVLLLLALIYAIYRWIRAGLDRDSAVYLGAIGSWCAYPMLRLFSTGAASVASPTSTVRHSILYLMLVNQVVGGSGNGRRPRAIGSVWTWAILLGAPLGALFAWAEIRLFADLYGNGLRATLLVNGPEFFFFTLHGAIALHHFDIELFAWRFRDERIGPELRSRMANW